MRDVQVQQHTPNSWYKQRAKILNFISRYSDKRITLATLNSLLQLHDEQLNSSNNSEPQAAVYTYIREGHLLGVAYYNEDGNGHCLIVVHPSARNQGIGVQLLQALIKQFQHFHCYVAIDNIPSLKLCFKSNLQANSMVKGPTGKMTLRFERSIAHENEAAGHLNALSK